MAKDVINALSKNSFNDDEQIGKAACATASLGMYF